MRTCCRWTTSPSCSTARRRNGPPELTARGPAAAILPVPAGLGRDFLYRRQQVLEHGALGELDLRGELHSWQERMTCFAEAQLLRQRLQLRAVNISAAALGAIAAALRRIDRDA